MKTVLKILLFLLSAPLMVALVVLESSYVLKTGSSYGMWVYGGIAVSALIAIIFALTYLITAITARTAKTVKAVRRGTAAMAVVGIFFTVGLWSIIDVVFPDIFSQATSNTITFDDVRENYNERADIHMNLLNRFIRYNVANGNLRNKSLEEYLAEGYTNAEVQDLLATNFTCMDKAGYASFMSTGPWLNLANSGRLTIPTLVHLVLNERETVNLPFYLQAERVSYVKNEKGEYLWTDSNGDPIKGTFVIENLPEPVEGEEQEGVQWTILDMQGGSMSVDLSGLLGNSSGLVNTVVTMLGGKNTLWEIQNAVAKFISSDAVAGSYIFLDIDTENMKINLVSATEERGVLGYQDMAWLNSNNLLMLVTSLFPARNIMYVFGGVLVVMSVAIGMIRENQFRKRHGLGKDPDDDPNVNIQPAAPQRSAAETAKGRSLSPYMQSYYRAQQEYINRMRR